MADPQVIFLDDGKVPPDLWLVKLDEQGTFKPLDNTEPIRMPPSWVKALDEERARGVRVDVPSRKATNEEVAQWAERHDLRGSASDLRAAFEDAESLHLTYGASVGDGRTFSQNHQRLPDAAGSKAKE